MVHIHRPGATARFKPLVEAQHAALSGGFSEHMGQPLRHTRLAGALLGQTGAREGMVLMREAEDRAQLDRLLEMSPYRRAVSTDCRFSLLVALEA